MTALNSMEWEHVENKYKEKQLLVIDPIREGKHARKFYCHFKACRKFLTVQIKTFYNNFMCQLQNL